MSSRYGHNAVIPTARRSNWPVHLAIAIAVVALFVWIGSSAIAQAEADEALALAFTPAEAAAFEAGRVAAHADLSGAVVEAYEQGRRDGLALAKAEARP